MAALDRADEPAIAAALLGDGAWAAAIIAPLLSRPDAGWPLAGRVVDGRATLSIVRRPGFALTVTTLRPQAPSGGVVAGGRQLFARVLAGRGRLDRWHAGPVGDDFRAAGAPPLGPCRPRALAPGDVAAIDGRIEAHRFVVDEGALILLTLTLAADAAPLLRDYTLPDGRMCRIVASEGSAAQAAMLVEVLGALGAGTAGLAAASTHPAFFVRWAAMRHWLASDARAAAATLTHMANADPHPEVRNAAKLVREMMACPA